MPAPRSEDDAQLLEYLRDRDAECPVCHYNLRNLERAVCPECQHELVLTVGTPRPRFGWLIVALVPGMFSGLCALFLAVPIVVSYISPNSTPPPPFVLVFDGFGLLSGGFAIALARHRYRFLRLPDHTQSGIAITTWAIHVLMFFVALGLIFL